MNRKRKNNCKISELAVTNTKSKIVNFMSEILRLNSELGVAYFFM